MNLTKHDITPRMIACEALRLRRRGSAEVGMTWDGERQLVEIGLILDGGMAVFFSVERDVLALSLTDFSERYLEPAVAAAAMAAEAGVQKKAPQYLLAGIRRGADLYASEGWPP